MKTLILIPMILMLIAGGQCLAADHGAGTKRTASSFPGKPQAPVILRWATNSQAGRLEATLIPLQDFDELVVQLYVPSDNGSHAARRYKNGRRGESIAVSWEKVSTAALPRLLVSMRIGDQSTTRTLARPLDSEQAAGSWSRERRRKESQRRVDRENRLVILPATTHRDP